MLIRKTSSQIKLVLALNNQYRVYNLLTQKVTWFRYKHQMLRHYGDNNLLIDIINSKILNGEYEGRRVLLHIGYREYKEFNGAIVQPEATTVNDIILQNGIITRAEATTLIGQIAYTLSIIRYLHGERNRENIDYAFTTSYTSNPVLNYEWLPRNRISHADIRDAQSTRPYDRHMTIRDWREIRDSITVTSRAIYGQSDGITINNNATTTYTAPPREEIRTDLIQRYHSGGTITPKNGANDNSRRYFGIELEIDNNNSYNNNVRNRMATKLHNILNENGNYNELVKFENDGSLSNNGIEIIFQPMTYAYIQEKKEKIFEALSAVDSMGYSSHDVGTCGLHIHVSRTELPDNILDKVLMIFENFKNELVAFSRRNENQMRWCKFMCDNLNVANISKNTFEQARRYGSINGHHYVINNQNRNTVEFRLFRGTTNKRSFMAAIQLIDNIVSIAQKRETIEGLTWLDIINYNEEYIELKAYNVKRSIYSTHVATEIIDVQSTNLRAVILVRPHQLRLEGDR